MSDLDPFRNPWFCDAASWAARAQNAESARAIRQLFEFGQEQAALARHVASGWTGATGEEAGRLQRDFAERFRQSFGPVFAATVAPMASQGQATLRYQAAMQRHASLLASIAQAAADRFTAALSGDAGPPITSLRELQALWIDCGERAFAEVAHGEAFAAAQAELLAAWVEWRATQSDAHGGAGAR